MKLRNVIITICYVFITSLTALGQQQLSEINGIVRKTDFQQKSTQLSPVARRAIQQGEVPGQFEGVRERFADKVKMLSQAQKSAIQQGMKSDGVINARDLSSFTPNPGEVYVDPSSDLVMQFASANDDDLLVFQPQLHMVFDEFTIPEQEVGLTLANTTETMPNTNVKSNKNGLNYDMVMEFDSTTFEVKENGVTMKVALVGSIMFSNPRIEGHYSKNNGYKFVFKTGEQINMKVYAEMKYKKVIEEPIWGFKIKAGKYGECDLGVFMVIDLEGKVNLEVRVDQGYELTAGIRGNTTYYVPTKLRPVIEVDNWCDIGYTLAGEITAFAGIQCKTKLKVKGYKLLEVVARAGMEGKVETDGTYLDADIGMRMKVNGNALSKKFTLIDKYYSFFQTRELDYGNYKMEILEACAFRDFVIGKIETIDTHEPYSGKVKVHLVKANGTTKDFEGTADNKGYFAITNVPMKKGDKVAIKLDGVNNLSNFVNPSIPFNEIKLFYADYYTGDVHGMIAGKVSKYEHLLPKAGNNANSNAIAAVNNINPMVNSAIVKPHSNIEDKLRNFKNSLITYKGPVSVSVTHLPQAVLINSSASTGGNAQRSVRRIRSVQKSTKQISANKYNTAQKAMKNLGNVSSPFGFFTVKNVELNPLEHVQAKVVVEGFEVRSDKIITDGIMVLPIQSESLSSSRNGMQYTVRAEQSFAVVSALRSNTTPTGQVHMVFGKDMIHDAIAQPYASVSDFKQCKKPFLWFDKKVSLQPIPDSPGSAMAQTGAWSSSINYSGMPEVFSPFTTGSHAFEMVSYKYKGAELGFKEYQESCPGCNSMNNIIDMMQNGTLSKNQFQNLNIGHGPMKAPIQVPRQQQVQGAVINY